MSRTPGVWCGLALFTVAVALAPPPASAALVFTNTHAYEFDGDPSAVEIQVEVFDNYLGDFGKYLWQYTVTNNSYDPVLGNGFSGFETDLPAAVPDLGDVFAPSADWEINCCSGAPVEWDLRDSVGPGILPGGTGVFGFTSLPRDIAISTGWFHTWVDNLQTDLVFYPFGEGPEVPDVRKPPTVAEPTTLLLLAAGVVGMAAWRRRLSR